MHVKEINDVKEKLAFCMASGLIKAWELPYENLLTRLSAAIFFVDPVSDKEEGVSECWVQLGSFSDFSYRFNAEGKLSALPYRVTFSKEEKEKNEAALHSAASVPE